MATNEVDTGDYDDEHEFDPSSAEFRDSELGEGIDPVADAKKPGQRRGLFMVGSGIAILAFIIVAGVLRSNGDKPKSSGAKKDSVAQGNQVATEARPDSIMVTQAITPEPVSVTQAAPSTNIIDAAAIEKSLQAADSANRFNNPARTDPAGTTNAANAQANNPSNGGISGAGGTGPGNTATGPDYANTESMPMMPGSGTTSGSPVSSQEAAVEKARVREMRRAQVVAQARAADSVKRATYAAWVESEKKRLSAPTHMSLGNGGGDLTSAASEKIGQSRFASAGRAAAQTATGTADDSTDDGAENVIDGISIPPGTQIRAETVTEYRSDIPGDQTVQIRLVEPLRSGGRTILPAGTLGYGKASSNAGSAGRSAYVQLNVTTFQTRQGKIYRGVKAQAGDPETLSMAIKGKTDRRLAEVVARGLAATVLDVGFSATSQRLAYKAAGQQQAGGSNGLVATPTDVALLQAQEKARGIIETSVGDERSVRPAVVLPKGTAFIMFFGF